MQMIVSNSLLYREQQAGTTQITSPWLSFDQVKYPSVLLGCLIKLTPTKIHQTPKDIPEFLSMRSSQMPDWADTDHSMYSGLSWRQTFPKTKRWVDYLCPETCKQYNRINTKYISLSEEFEYLSSREHLCFISSDADSLFWIFSGNFPIYNLLIFHLFHHSPHSQIGWFKRDT